MSPPSLLLLLLLGVSSMLAAPTEEPAPADNSNPFLEGLDEFLAAFEGLALPGDPLAATEEPSPAEASGDHQPGSEQLGGEVVPEEAPCLGCVQEVESDSAELRELAQLAAELLEEELNMTQVTEVTQVYRAGHQVVNGYKYFVTLELRPTNCSRPLESEELVCAPDPAADTQLYSVEILEPAQLDSTPRLLTYDELLPEEVAHLPGLFASETPPSQPDTPATEAPPGATDVEEDLLFMISEMQRFTEAEKDGFQEDPTVMRHRRRYGITL